MKQSKRQRYIYIYFVSIIFWWIIEKKKKKKNEMAIREGKKLIKICYLIAVIWFNNKKNERK